MKATLEQITAFVAEFPEENHTLEFKRKASADVLELHKEDRRLLGEAVSGFANAVGGLLILGIATEKHQNVDRAKGVVPIGDVAKVAYRIRSYVNECAAPVVEGVKVRSVAGTDGSGLVLVSVPRGQARPHMSTAPGHHTYYRRVMDSFVPMEAYEVEEMMRLKTEPKLEFIHSIRPAGSIGSNRMFELLFGLANRSRTTAKFPYITYKREPNKPSVARYGLDGNGNDLWPRLNDIASGSVMFAAGADRVLHPGQELFVSKLDYREVFDHRQPDWGVSKLKEGEGLVLQFQYGCEDSPADTVQLSISRERLLLRRP